MSLRNATLSIDEKDYPLLACSGREAIGEHFRIDARALGHDIPPSELLGKAFTLTLTPGASTEMTIEGVVLRARSTIHMGTEELTLTLGPAHQLLSYGQSSAVFLKKTAKDIVDAVLSGAGAPAATWSAATPPVREYSAQYRESHFDFLDRITREDGVYWFYDHDASSALTFADDASKAESVSGTFFHRRAHGVRSPEAWVSQLTSKAIARTEKLTTRDYDPQRPKLELGGDGSADAGKREIYEWPAATSDAADAKKRATSGLEALRARILVVRGRSDRFSIRVGRILEIDSTSLEGGLAKLFVIAVDWTLGTGGDPTISFAAVPSTTLFRLPLRPRTHASLGTETAWVRGASGQEIDVDANGDTIVQPLWDRNPKRDEHVAIRSRSGQMQLGRSMTIPRVGWSMLVGHREGDIDRPWIVARLVDGTHPLPYKLPDNKTQTAWQTLTSNADGSLSEFYFEDKKGSEMLVLHAAKDMNVEIGNDEARTVGNNHTLEVDKDRAETVDADDKLTVTLDQTTTVKGAESTTVEGSRSLTIKGNEETTVTGKRAEAVTAERTVDVGKNRKLTVTGGVTAASKKGFTREVLKKATMTTSAGWTTQTDAGLTTTTKGDASETVAATRTSIGQKGLAVAIKGDLTDTIAAAHAVTATGGASESTKAKSSLTVGAALTAIGPEIEIIGESEIAIQCGGSTITIKSSEVTIKSPAIVLAGATVVLSGAQVKHNP